MGFSFSATARCNLCGEYLSSSDEKCDHDGQEVVEYMFRRIGDEKPHVVSVRACAGFQWHALKDMVDDDWIAYQLLGPKSSIKNMLCKGFREDIDDVPHVAMSTDAPKEVEEYGD